MTRLMFKYIVWLLLLIFAIFQAFNGVVLDVTAQDATPTVPKPPYIEPEPVKQDIKPGGQVLQGDSLDASSVSTLILATGEASIHGLIYESGFLWASTRTAPAKIIKINPATTPMSVVSSITLDAGRDNAEDIVAANGYIWSIASDWSGNWRAYLVRIDPATMAVQYTELLVDAQNYLDLAVSLKYAHGKLWVGGYNVLAEIDISNPNNPAIVVHNFSAIIDQQFVWGTALASDANYLWAIFGQGMTAFPYWQGSTVVRIDPANPGVNYLAVDIPAIFPDDMIHTNGFLYTSSEDPGQPSYTYRFPSTITPFGTQLANNSSISYGVFFNPLDLYSFWGAYTGSPGMLIKFDLNMNTLWTLSLPTSPSNFDDPSEIVFDENGNMYVSTFTNPARLVKYTAPDAVTVSISKSGNNAVLTWNNADALVERFEVWRSTDPYFTPQGTTPYATVTAAVGTNTYTDVGALGDVNNNYFYVVRAFNDFGLLSPISNRVGEFDFSIVRERYNTISLPVTDSSLLTADDLGNAVGATTVSRWVATTQSLSTRTVGISGFNFPLSTGRAYFVYTPGAGPTIFTTVGNVPSMGSISFSITRGTGNCLMNLLSLPLDRPGLTTADSLANSIGGVPIISRWSATIGGFTTRTVGVTGVNFPTRIGYPYWPCADTTGGGATWP